MEILELKSTIIEMKISLKSSTVDLNRHEKESVNLNIGQLILSSLQNRKRKKKKGKSEQRTEPKGSLENDQEDQHT